MIAGNVTSIAEGRARRARKTVSFQDKLEEARERRAATLSRQPANNPGPAAPAAPTTLHLVHPRPTSPEAPVGPETASAEPAGRGATAPPAVETAEETSRATGLTWTIRSLTALLLLLTGLAVHQVSSTPGALAPDFAPPLARLSSQAFGPPLLASVSHRTDRPLRSVDRVALAPATPAPAPVLRTAAPAPRGPAVMPSVVAPALPRAAPAAVVVVPSNLRPPERPSRAASGG